MPRRLARIKLSACSSASSSSGSCTVSIGGVLGLRGLMNQSQCQGQEQGQGQGQGQGVGFMKNRHQGLHAHAVSI